MARVKVLTDRGWIEIPPPYTDIRVLEDKRLQVTSISGFVSFWSTNEYLSEHGEAENRPKGKWIRDFSGNEFYWYCSNCKTEYYEEDLYMGGNEFPNYCPNCGADMR